LIVKAETDCKSEQGRFRMQSTAVSRQDLIGDLNPDEVAYTAFSCNTAARLWDGNGG
jgi:hypothetical protein